MAASPLKPPKPRPWRATATAAPEGPFERLRRRLEAVTGRPPGGAQTTFRQKLVKSQGVKDVKSIGERWEICEIFSVDDYPVVRRELRSYGYSYSLLNGELRSYQEFPNHILDEYGKHLWKCMEWFGKQSLWRDLFGHQRRIYRQKYAHIDTTWPYHICLRSFHQDKHNPAGERSPATLDIRRCCICEFTCELAIETVL